MWAINTNQLKKASNFQRPNFFDLETQLLVNVKISNSFPGHL